MSRNIRDLERAYETLQALEAAGVDNWEGYDIAMDTIRRKQETEDRLIDTLERIEEALARGVYEPSERGAGYGFQDSAHEEATNIILELLKD